VFGYPVAQIDLPALRHNLSVVKKHAPQSQIISVVKANAYGHGMLDIAHALTDSDAFAVARVTEAINLRENGIDKPIIVLQGFHGEDELLASAKYDLSPVFHHQYQLDLLSSTQLDKPLAFCWLMVETGMHRLGFETQEVNAVFVELQQSVNTIGEVGLMSHFANADLVMDARNQNQLEKITNITSATVAMSMANSAAIVSYPESHQQWVRPGIMLYGSSPFADKTAAELDLQPVMKFKSVITSIRELNKGDQVGYGGDWVAEKTTRSAIVSVGYGDGYLRYLDKQAYVDINGKLAKVLGRVSMDMICVDINDHQQVQVGDEVVLWGSQHLSVDQVARWADTISYELLCQVSQRVPRVYV
jgi:alanine racemase